MNIKRQRKKTVVMINNLLLNSRTQKERTNGKR